MIARRLGMTGALGTVAEAVDGRYTGRLVGEMLHGPAKAAAVRALARREQLDLGRCAAYSDSANDIPMLSLVGHPFVVNPDGRLRKYARAHGWRVRDFRTGRKAARIGVPAAVLLGAAAAPRSPPSRCAASGADGRSGPTRSPLKDRQRFPKRRQPTGRRWMSGRRRHGAPSDRF